MTATTLGDLFPEMRHAVPGRERKSHPTPESPGKPARHVTRQGTADRLKMLYPEIESTEPCAGYRAGLTGSGKIRWRWSNRRRVTNASRTIWSV